MRVFKVCLVGVLLLTTAGFAQELKFPAGLDKLASKASEVVDVNMDRRMLEFASRFLSNQDADDAEARQLIKNLKGIYVKSYEFEKDGEYSLADVDAFRAQLRGPQWTKMIEARSRRDGENVEVFFRNENGTCQGLAIIAAEPRELTLVNIEGPIDPEQLSSLGGQFGIPKIDTGKKLVKKPAPTGQAVKK
jgi:Domain of unknown function (DUF4252)